MATTSTPPTANDLALDTRSLSDRELDLRLVEALRAVGDLQQKLVEARAWFDALHTEKDRRSAGIEPSRSAKLGELERVTERGDIAATVTLDARGRLLVRPDPHNDIGS
jgi:hypothetical protein